MLVYKWKEVINMKWLGYCGFLGIIGFLYFFNKRLATLSGFLFFSLFKFYYLDKINKLQLDFSHTQKVNALSKKIYTIPLITLFIISNSYLINIQAVIILSIVSIVITLVGSTMIPYYYIKRILEKI